MQRVIHMMLVGVMLSVGLFISGCGSSDSEQVPFAILAMDNGTTGPEPYILKDGTATLLKDINPGTAGSIPLGFTSFNGKIYFFANDVTNGTALWVTDGTATGTTMVKIIDPGYVTKSVTKSVASKSTFSLSIFTVFNGKLYFGANDGTAGTELWVTDGTAAGTVMLKDINAVAGGSSYPEGFTIFNNKLYFSARTFDSGYELWVTDGTAPGTVMLKDIYTGTDSSSNPNSSDPHNFTVFNDKLYFSAYDGNGYELWVTDGTAVGTAILKDISAGTGSSNPYNFTVFNGKICFCARTAEYGYELWVTDGTAAGTVMLKDINTVAGGSSYPEGFTVINGKLYFQADNGTKGTELWVTDGTAAGSVMLKDINTVAGGSSYPGGFTVINGKFYFQADDGINGTELWVSDGTAAGTVMLKDIDTAIGGNSSPVPLQFMASFGLAYLSGNFTNNLFIADDGIYGSELWSSDGTTTGTKILVDFNNGSGDGVSFSFYK